MKSRQLFFVAWDIACDSRRRLIRERSSLFAAGGQKSAYECWVEPHRRDRFWQHLCLHVDSESDRLLMLRLDPRWPVICLGAAVSPERSDLMMVS